MFRESMLRSTLLVAGLLAGAVSPCAGQVYPPGVQVPTSVFTGPERITVGGHLVFAADFNLTSEIHFQDGRAVAFQNLDQSRPFASVGFKRSSKRQPLVAANTALRVTNLVNVNYLSPLNTRDRWLTIDLDYVWVVIHKGSATRGDQVTAAEFKATLGDYIRIEPSR